MNTRNIPSSTPEAPEIAADALLVDAELLDRYLAGELDAAKREQVESWLYADEEAGRVVGTLASAEFLSLQPRDEAKAGQAWRMVESRTRNFSPRRPVARRGRFRYLTIGVACVTLLSVVGSIQHSGWIPWQSQGQSAEQFTEYRTGVGERTQLQLPDGSNVMLNVGSTLRYSRAFGNETRDVYLDGEALFTVTNRAGAPFIVHTSDSPTRVLGTSFTVRRYVADMATKVIVAEGKVGFGDAILTTGDAATGIGTKIIELNHHVDIATALAWTKKELVLAGVPVADVIPELQRWYGITLVVDDPALLRAPVTTKFTTEAPQQIIEVLQRILDARVEHTDSTVVFRPR